MWFIFEYNKLRICVKWDILFSDVLDRQTIPYRRILLYIFY